MCYSGAFQREERSARIVLTTVERTGRIDAVRRQTKETRWTEDLGRGGADPFGEFATLLLWGRR